MRNFLIDTIDSAVLLLVKWRYKLVMPTQKQMSAAEVFFESWKSKYPETFNNTKTVAPLDPLTRDLIGAIAITPPEEDTKKYDITEGGPIG